MSYPKLIVTISRDESLQCTRTALLHRIGYSVIALRSDTDVLEFLAMPGLPFVNLILMCHSIPEPSRVALCKALKAKRPESPILMLYNGYDPNLAEEDGRLQNLKPHGRFPAGVYSQIHTKKSTTHYQSVT